MNWKGLGLLFAVCLICISGAFSEAAAREKPFPSKTIELLCPWGAGGSTSMGGRIVAGTLSEYLGSPVVVINKTGGGGSVAASYVARSKPDGYTLLIFNSGTNGIMLATRALDYTNSSFEPLALYGSQELALVVNNDSPWKKLSDLVADCKQNPGKFKYSSAGIGTGSHFSMEHFKIAAGGLRIDHVPFKSGPESVAAILGGHVHMATLYSTDIKGAVQAGRLRILAVPSAKRSEDFLNSPTFAELGYPDVRFTSWYGVAAPRGIPQGVADKLKDALYKTIRHQDVKKMLLHIGYVPIFKDAGEFTKFAREEEMKFQKIAKEAGIKID